MSDKYRLERVEANEQWDEFVRTSENGTIFLYSDYLKSLQTSYGLYFCYCNKELRGALAVMEDHTGENAILHDFVIYNGILIGSPMSGQNRAQRISEQFRLAEFIATELTSMYHSVKISLHPSWIDIRPFLWVNYGTDKPMYKVDVRYTSYVDISDFTISTKLEAIGEKRYFLYATIFC